MAILYQNDEVKIPSIKRRVISRWIKETVTTYNKEVGDISYVFCSDEKILSINNQYLNHDYYTDIITFDYGEEDIISGEIFISLDTVKSNAKEFGIDYIDELHRIIIHGVLHLCGINDKSIEEREHMTECENLALEYLKSFQS